VRRDSQHLAALGRLLRRYRQEAQLTQEQLGFRTKLHPNYISLVERGRHAISFTALERWLDATGVSWSEFGREVDQIRQST